MRKMARLAVACSAVIPILSLSDIVGLAMAQPRDLKYCTILRDIMRRTKGMKEN